jgi:low temperature requirement protein LtrA
MLPTVRAILVFTHAHIPVLAALTAVSAGVALAIQQASEGELDAGARWALCGGAALYLVCLTVAQRALVRGVPAAKVAARGIMIAALALLAAAAATLEPWAFVALTAAVLLVLVAFEMWVYNRHRAETQPG